MVLNYRVIPANPSVSVMIHIHGVADGIICHCACIACSTIMPSLECGSTSMGLHLEDELSSKHHLCA